jgi:hypothetical protein
MVFRLVSNPGAPELWWAADEVLDAAEDLRRAPFPHRQRAIALLEACARELRQFSQPYEEELTDDDPRCVEERAAFTAAQTTVVQERGRWMRTGEGVLIVRYADCASAEEPEWLFSDELFASPPSPRLALVTGLSSE